MAQLTPSLEAQLAAASCGETMVVSSEHSRRTLEGVP
ncbi:unnamed protein product [Linum tenue]|uniref:Uncharacterized protein n=2 Tax=Linum tenue TaxID=586396 RepID=A0AAV0M980_9ROSI|nr:unnamed protein product [Linum tenue]